MSKAGMMYKILALLLTFTFGLDYPSTELFPSSETYNSDDGNINNLPLIINNSTLKKDSSIDSKEILQLPYQSNQNHTKNNGSYSKKINNSERKPVIEKNNRSDCSDCDYDFTPYGSECCDTAWDEYGIDCATLENNYNWDCSGCDCPGDGGGGCDPNEVPNCNPAGGGDCCPEDWIGDGFEDCEDQAYGCDLTCYDNDGGDCESNQAPNQPYNEDPYDGEQNVSISHDLNWSCSDPDGDNLDYYVYFGTDSSPDGSEYLGVATGSSYSLGTLSYGAHYYWKVIAFDPGGLQSSSPVWYFYTEGAPDVSIYGYIRDGNNNGINGVTVSFSNGVGSTTTNSNGYYSKSVNYGYTGTTTPYKTGWNFTPTSRSYSNVTSNQTNQNFDGTIDLNADVEFIQIENTNLNHNESISIYLNNLNESFLVKFRGENDGSGTSPAQNNSLTMSFPQFNDDNDINSIDVNNSTSSDLTTYTCFATSCSNGGTVGGGDAYANYYMIESYDNNGWISGESNDLYVDISPNQWGEFKIYYRMALCETNWLNCTNDPSSSSYPNDCLNFDSYSITVNVMQTPDPADLYLSNNTIPNTIPYNGGTYSIHVNNSGDETLYWNTTSVPSWASVSPSSGSVNGGSYQTVNITFDANSSINSREGDLEFYNTQNSSDDEGFNFTQEGRPYNFSADVEHIKINGTTVSPNGTINIYLNNLNELFQIDLQGENDGADTSPVNLHNLTMSFPEYNSASDNSYFSVNNSSTSSDIDVYTWWDCCEINNPEWGVGGDGDANYYLIEGWDNNGWTAGESNSLSLNVKAKDWGSFDVYYRMALCGEAWSDCNYDPSGGYPSGNNPDCLGFESYKITVNILMASGSLTVNVANIPEGNQELPGSNGTVKLYNNAGSLIETEQTNNNGVAYFNDLSIGSDYYYKVYHNPVDPTTYFGEEYWGEKTGININGDVSSSFTRNMPYSWETKIYNGENEVTNGTITYGTELTVNVQVINPNPSSFNSKLRLIFDQNQEDPFEFDGLSGSYSIPGNNSDYWFSFSFTPEQIGDYYRIVGTQANNGGYIYTDGHAWPENPIITVDLPPQPAVEIPILMYHKIDENTPTEYWVSTNDFENQMNLLVGEEYNTISPDDIYNYIFLGNSLPSNPVLIIADDGYENFYTDAYPILMNHNFTASNSIITNYIADNGNMNNSWETDPTESQYSAPHLNWSQILEMYANGISFVAHTKTHQDLTSLSDAEAQEEIAGSKAALEAHLGDHVNFFTYPFGEYRDLSEIQQMVADAGYLGAFAAWGGMENTATADIFALNRIYIKKEHNLGQFWALIDSDISSTDLTLYIVNNQFGQVFQADAYLELFSQDGNYTLADGITESYGGTYFTQMPEIPYSYKIYNTKDTQNYQEYWGSGSFSNLSQAIELPRNTPYLNYAVARNVPDIEAMEPDMFSPGQTAYIFIAVENLSSTNIQTEVALHINSTMEYVAAPLEQVNTISGENSHIFMFEYIIPSEITGDWLYFNPTISGYIDNNWVITDYTVWDEYFSLSINPDNLPPVVVSENLWPQPEENNVPVNSIIYFEFNESVQPNTVNSTSVIIEAEGQQILGQIETIFGLNYLYKFTPVQDFPYDTEITCRLTSEILDMAGNFLDGNNNGSEDSSPNDDYIWTFSTIHEGAHYLDHSVTLDGNDYPLAYEIKHEASNGGVEISIEAISSWPMSSNEGGIEPGSPAFFTGINGMLYLRYEDSAADLDYNNITVNGITPEGEMVSELIEIVDATDLIDMMTDNIAFAFINDLSGVPFLNSAVYGLQEILNEINEFPSDVGITEDLIAQYDEQFFDDNRYDIVPIPFIFNLTSANLDKMIINLPMDFSYQTQFDAYIVFKPFVQPFGNNIQNTWTDQYENVLDLSAYVPGNLDTYLYEEPEAEEGNPPILLAEDSYYGHFYDAVEANYLLRDDIQLFGLNNPLLNTVQNYSLHVKRNGGYLGGIDGTHIPNVRNEYDGFTGYVYILYNDENTHFENIEYYALKSDGTRYDFPISEEPDEFWGFLVMDLVGFTYSLISSTWFPLGTLFYALDWITSDWWNLPYDVFAQNLPNEFLNINDYDIIKIPLQFLTQVNEEIEINEIVVEADFIFTEDSKLWFYPVFKPFNFAGGGGVIQFNYISYEGIPENGQYENLLNPNLFEITINATEQLDCADVTGGDAEELTYCADTDGDGLGNSGTETVYCETLVEDGWVLDCTDNEPNCASNDTDDCGVCGGGNADNMGCGCFEPAPQVYYPDTDGDGLGAGESSEFCKNPGVGWSDNADDMYPDCAANFYDCNEDCGGSAEPDSCEVCSGGNTNHEADSDIDCNGDCFGVAFEDSCGVCSGGNSGHDADNDDLGCGCDNPAALTYCEDTDEDGLGNPGTDTEYCLQDLPEYWVEDCNDSQPNCATNDTDACDVCGGDGWSCAHWGDVNQDYDLNVLDLILIVDFILYPDEYPLDENQIEIADVNEDSTINIADIIVLVGYMFEQLGRAIEIVDKITIYKTVQGLELISSGLVALDIQLSHSSGFEYSLTGDALLATSNPGENSTRMIIVNPESKVLFETDKTFWISKITAASASGNYINVNIVEIPAEFDLQPVYPNPFNPTTNITYALPVDGHVNLTVYNLSGQIVTTLLDAEQSAGYLTHKWDASAHPSGLYFLKMYYGSDVQIQKLMLVK